MIIGENIFVMLLTKQRFKDFTKKEICNAHKNTEVLIAIDVHNFANLDGHQSKIMYMHKNTIPQICNF